MIIYPTVKMAPIVGMAGFGGGTSGQIVSGGGAVSGGFGGYDYIGVITKDGEKSVSASGNVIVQRDAAGGNAFSYAGGSTLNGITGDGTTRYYEITNPIYASGSWNGKGSWTSIEKYYRASGSWGNMNRAHYYNYNGGNKYIHRTRHDNRTGGCGGSWGTTYPYVSGSDGSYGQNTIQPFCSVGYSGWWVNLGSWDHTTEKYWWARADSNMQNGAMSEVNSPNKTNSDWESYLGTGDDSYINFDMNSSYKYADFYLIYGKATTTLAEAQKYNMLSLSNHIDPDTE